jgi:uncharacterized protein (UPF0332 family)
MKIEEVKIKLPKKEKSIENYFKGCERRKKFVSSDPERSLKHLKKAKHDLNRAIAEFEDDVWDWSIIKSYYSIHHAGNALLLKNKGFFSKDHSCLIIALKVFDLIDKELFIKLRNIYENFSDTLSLDLTFELRKISQYSVDEWEDLTKEDARKVLELAKRFVSYVEGKIG